MQWLCKSEKHVYHAYQQTKEIVFSCCCVNNPILNSIPLCTSKQNTLPTHCCKKSVQKTAIEKLEKNMLQSKSHSLLSSIKKTCCEIKLDLVKKTKYFVMAFCFFRKRFVPRRYVIFPLVAYPRARHERNISHIPQGQVKNPYIRYDNFISPAVRHNTKP